MEFPNREELLLTQVDWPSFLLATMVPPKFYLNLNSGSDVNSGRDQTRAGLWDMESTSVIQQEALPEDSPSQKAGRFPKVSQKWLDKPRVVNHNPNP